MSTKQAACRPAYIPALGAEPEFMTVAQAVERQRILDDFRTLGRTFDIIKQVAYEDIDTLTLCRCAWQVEYDPKWAKEGKQKLTAMQLVVALIAHCDDEDEFLTAMATAFVME